MVAVTALYRRYRPESFADVIGQEHVTDPLRQALRADRTNHAYLFSGPRGCGKTTSARILARCLNCVQGPTDTPCGECDSCRDLARDAAGSLDVVEIDAASHGGVDDARDLRERAVIAPVRDRYKVFIIDEAHMVTTQGFNALLKLVEEPPEHVKFVFATTEPDKVLPTIRSRTHHYPFHLVPADTLSGYLTRLCEREGVPVGAGVIPLVVRAGGGSVRDSLSVLDQLMAGAGPDGVDHDGAAALLGFTSGPLLDDIVTAIGAGDAAALFAVVDRVLAAGQDPRRFVEDLLSRFRDLIVVQAVGERADAVLRGVPGDQLQRLHHQASALPPAQLSRAADLTSTALTEMVGVSNPRIHIELLCARILLPSSDDTQRGAMVRLERLERRIAAGAVTAAQTVPGAPPAPPAAALPVSAGPPAGGPAAEDDGGAEAPRAGALADDAPADDAPAVDDQPSPTDVATGPAEPAASAAEQPDPRPEAPSGSAPAPAPAPVDGGQPPAGDDPVQAIRRLWPEVLGDLRTRSRATWSVVSEYADVPARCRGRSCRGRGAGTDGPTGPRAGKPL
ncbi:MAG: hypothetical protein CSB46_10205 [Micrococcales bacterium]|nr:MAG: hypothetical protein CSB46_10205 [Micrococcales bacterium]